MSARRSQTYTGDPIHYVYLNGLSIQNAVVEIAAKLLHPFHKRHLEGEPKDVWIHFVDRHGQPDV
uniref:Uncharacterized protein n=1 Tax=Oryza rufipogon TaxID=4529 RepID=A0A0E0QF40_ORYRU